MSSHVMTSTQLTEFGRKNSVSCPICRKKVVLRTLGDLQVSKQAGKEESPIELAADIDSEEED